MNKLDTARRAQVLSALVEGNSIRSTVRMTGVAKNTIVKLLADAGGACTRYLHENIRNVTAKKIQCDEIWSFCYSKQENVPADKQGRFGFGDVWTWTAIDADSKLLISYLVGARDGETACAFVADLAGRLANRVQLTTDGHKAYPEAVEGAFGGEIDYAQLVKIYENDTGNTSDVRYCPGEHVESRKEVITGNPDWSAISTSYIERQNLTMRMRMRRFTRLTNAFSKKIENHEHAIAIYAMHYNYVRIHQSIRMTPAMKAGLTRKLWSLEDVVALID
jgi:IS1 family transposase